MVLRRFPTSSGYLFYGPLPTVKVLMELHRNKVYAIWNLAKEFKMISDYERSFVHEVIEGNISDYDVPNNMGKFVSQVNYVVSLLKNGKKVFVHCHGGHGRTGTALAAIKVALDKVDPQEALTMVNQQVKGPDTDEQEDFVKYIAPYLTGKKSGVPPKFPKQPKQYKVPDYYGSLFNKQYELFQTPKDKPVKKEVSDEYKCKFCNDPNITSIQKWQTPTGLKKFYLCKMCNHMWDAADDDERDSWVGD